MHRVWLLAATLAMLPNCSFAQEPSDCAVNYTRYDNSGKFVSKGCQTYAEFPPSVLKEDRLRNIGALGPAGRMRTPYIMKLLGDEDWGVRAEAAKTLGLIGETSATPDLAAAINAHDWKLTFEAMTSLKNLKAPEADGTLKAIAGAHWQPGIRAAAQRLLDYGPELKTPTTPGWYWPYRSPIDRYCDTDEGTKERAIAVPIDSRPHLIGAALAERIVSVNGGRLVAVDAGEFGGVLEFQPTAGAAINIIQDEAVVAVVAGKKGIFALTGSGHMGLDDGFIYKVEPAVDGSWSAQIIWRLPGAPLEANYTPAGEMGISTNYGDVFFHPDSGLEWISCPVRN